MSEFLLKFIRTVVGTCTCLLISPSHKNNKIWCGVSRECVTVIPVFTAFFLNALEGEV